jgi:hypothetical protein
MGPRRGGWTSALLAALVLVLAGAPMATATTRPAPPPRPLVLVYGDSLVHEAMPYLPTVFRVARIPYRAVGASGGAVCDLLPAMRQDVGRRPTAVVIEFSGNALSACMRDSQGRPLEGQAWLDKYRWDTQTAIDLFRPTGAAVWLATAPMSFTAEKRGIDDVARLAAMEQDLAVGNPNVFVTDAAQSVLFDGHWTLTLPCLPNEPCTGTPDLMGRRLNQVRATDTAHFCPVPYPQLENCPVHASGGLRYALGLTVPALRRLGAWDPRRAVGSMAEGWP